MCSIDLDPCEVWSERAVRAAVPHRCDSCRLLISTGEPCLRHFNVYEGEATSERMCAPCWFVREQFVDAHGQSFPPSTLINQLEECIGENDDEEDDWRPLLALVLRRYRRSDVWRRHILKGAA